MNDAALLDELAFNATASTTVQYVDGWALRASPALPFRRSNCAMPLRDAGSPPWYEIDAFYAARNLPRRAQVSSRQGPEIDAAFAARGFAIEAPVDVMVATTSATYTGNTPAVDVTTQTGRVRDASFPETYGDLHDDERVRAYGRMLQTIGPDAFFVVATLEAEPVGMVFGVVERSWCGIYGLTTRPHARGRGVASTAMRALSDVARAAGARDMYLQMERDNTPARALYEKTGFRVAYGYHYRVKK